MAVNYEQFALEQTSRISDVIARYAHLRAQEEAFRTGGPFARLSAFVVDFDRQLVQRTLQAYEPAVPVTTEGLLLAASGFLHAYLLLPVFVESWRRRRRLRAKLRGSVANQAAGHPRPQASSPLIPAPGP